MSAFEKNSSVQAVHAAYRQGEQFQDQGNYPEAVAVFEQLIKLQPRWSYAYCGLGSVFASMGRLEEARKQLRKAISLKDDHAAFHAKIAEVLNRLDDPENAIEAADRAITLEPGNIDYLVNKATILHYNNDPQAAYDLLVPEIKKGNTSDLLVRIYASLCGSLNKPQEGIEALQPIANTVNSDPIVTATHEFVLARLYDQAGLYDLAYDAARKGAELRNDRYDPQEREALFQQRARAWSQSRLPDLAHSRVASDQPVFIVGMPRSGTTLVEQIIAAHPDTYACGELVNIRGAADEIAAPTPNDPDLPSIISTIKQATLDRVARRILRDMQRQAPNGAKPKRITDKMPLNFQHIGFIEQLFPNARIVYCARNPLDNFISCYLLDFAGINNHAYTYSPEHFADFYAIYLRYMAHWRSASGLPILDIQYEDIVAGQEAQSRRLIDFLGLEWSDRCLEFFSAERAVVTASAQQVRKPIYSSSHQRYKNYEKHLGPIRQALTDHGIEIPA